MALSQQSASSNIHACFDVYSPYSKQTEAMEWRYCVSDLMSIALNFELKLSTCAYVWGLWTQVQISNFRKIAQPLYRNSNFVSIQPLSTRYGIVHCSQLSLIPFQMFNEVWFEVERLSRARCAKLPRAYDSFSLRF